MVKLYISLEVANLVFRDTRACKDITILVRTKCSDTYFSGEKGYRWTVSFVHLSESQRH